MNSTKAPALDSVPQSSQKIAFRDGLKACLPTMPGIFAWGLVTGMAMVKSGLSLWQALGMTFIVFAGSAQLASLPLIAAAAPVWVVFLTAMVVNLRFVIFAAVIGPHFGHLPWYKRLWYGYVNADITMGIFPRHFPSATSGDPARKVKFYAGIGYANWCAWQTGSVVGILFASQIPQSWGVGFAGTLALLAILIPAVINLPALFGVAAAALVSVALIDLPYRLGLLVAVAAGMAAAMIIDAWLERRGGQA